MLSSLCVVGLVHHLHVSSDQLVNSVSTHAHITRASKASYTRCKLLWLTWELVRLSAACRAVSALSFETTPQANLPAAAVAVWLLWYRANTAITASAAVASQV